VTHDDGQTHGRGKCRERFPIDILGQDGLENFLSELVRLDFTLWSTFYGAGFLRHTNLFRAKKSLQKIPRIENHAVNV
jgi:hypothetical protein